MSYLTKLKQFDNGIVNENRRLKSIYSKIVSESFEDDELEEELNKEDDLPEGGLEEEIKRQDTKGSEFWTEENEEEVPLEEVDEGAPDELPKDLKVVSAAELFGERLFAEGDDDLEPEPGLAMEGDDAISTMQDEYDNELGEAEGEEAIIKIDEEGLPEDEADPEAVAEAADVGMSPEEFFATSPTAPVNEEDERVPDPANECGNSPVSEGGEVPFEDYLAQQEKAKANVNEMYEDGNVTEGAKPEEEFLEVDDGSGDEDAPAETVAEHDTIDPLHDLGMDASFDEVEEDATPHMVDASEITGSGSSSASDDSSSDAVTEKKEVIEEPAEPQEQSEDEDEMEEAMTAQEYFGDLMNGAEQANEGKEEKSEDEPEEEPKEEEPADGAEEGEPAGEEEPEEPEEEEPAEDDEKPKKKSKKAKKDDEGDDGEDEKEIDESYSTLEDPDEDDTLPESVVESIKRNKRLFRK